MFVKSTFVLEFPAEKLRLHRIYTLRYAFMAVEDSFLAERQDTIDPGPRPNDVTTWKSFLVGLQRDLLGHIA